ncbi:MAG: hypothetical protein PF487_14785 [Bacteroidales bacterium]|jgi:hypothetical protein|nr:hypothetical protein [Bacteroidales bacterium]
MTEQFNKPEKLNSEELTNPKLTTVPVDTEELEAEEKIMKGVEDTVENDESTEEEIKAEYIEQLKESRIRFRPKKNAVKTVSETRVSNSIGRLHTERTQEVQTNVIVNQFDKKYKQKRKRKNKLTKTSRRNNRK